MVRTGVQLLATAAALAYLLWRIDVRRSITLIGGAEALPLVGALAILLALTWALAWRWQVLLASKGIREPLGWLVRAYFVGQAASQILPTAVGGDAVRILEHARRRPDAKGEAAAAVLIERAIGAVATLMLGATGLPLILGEREDLRSFIWLELVLGVLTVVAGVLLFSRRAARPLALLAPLATRLRVDGPARSVYAALHGYRGQPRALLAVLAISLGIQGARIVAIWLCALAAGIDLSLLPFSVLGPLLALVMMIPITINGLGVREAFFVVFLDGYGVHADLAFAAGFLFFALSIVAVLPGVALLLRGHFRLPVEGRVRRA